jgi:hypothetical protein
MKRKLPILVTLLGMLLLAPGSALAQATQTVSIEDGSVFVNGKKVASQNLPTSLQSIDPKTTLKFWSDDHALLEIKGKLFTVKNGTLVEVNKDGLQEGKIAVYFSADGESVPMHLFDQNKGNSVYSIRRIEGGKPMDSYVANLHERAAEIISIGHKIDAIQAPETAELALELKLGAENVARIAESFPRIQFESYLEDIQDNDRVLYRELMREQEMELETHRLAMQIREAKSRSDQERVAKQLREALDEIFQLKQENRKTEIKQLSAKLEDMQKRLKERESLRSEIVENRLRELLDQYRW